MIELWLVDLPKVAPALEALEREVPRLGSDDRARARRLREPAERRHRLAAYTALRILLERAGGPRVRGQRIVRPAGGKPRLIAASPAFSVSHTGELAMIGIARAHCIGVDLEARRVIAMSRRRREEIVAIAVGLGGPVRALVDPGTDAAVLQAWCRLEACAKARGTGVARLLSGLGLRQASGRTLSLASIETAARQLAGDAGLTVGDVRLPDGLYGAIATAPFTPPARPQRFPTTRGAIARLLPR